MNVKLLFDQNLSYKLPVRLADLFPGSVQVGSLGLAEATDTEIWRLAKDRDYTIVTLDADFAEMAALFGKPPFVIWLRCGNQRTQTIEALLRRACTTVERAVHDADIACIELY